MIIQKRIFVPEPLQGDYKITYHFAWWPVWINDQLVWLEQYKKVWEYTIRIRSIVLYTRVVTINCGGWDLRETKRKKL